MSTAPIATRERFQAWRAAVQQNNFEADPHLQSLIAHYGRDRMTDELRAFGERCATDLDEMVRENNQDENLPRLKRYDAIGNRVESIQFHELYHQIGREVYGTGLMSKYAIPGQELDTLSLLYLFAQNGEAGHACPCACTAGLIKILQADDEDRSQWLSRLYDPDYDTHFHGSQFLTEVQGGSDVGTNAVVAVPGDDGNWRLYGEKWFCSVVDAHLFLVTARPEGAPPGTKGLRAFAVERTLADGHVNEFVVRRLKHKLGTRSMASAEIDFEGAIAHPVGDFYGVLQRVLNTSRLYNAVCSAGMIQRSFREAHAYASTRAAFGHRIIDFPSTGRIVATLRVEAYAARASTFFLADLSDRITTGVAADFEQAAWRMLVNLNKYWTSHVGTTSVRDAIEVLGGNGTIEEFCVLPRLLRDSIVCEAWEGAHNVLMAQITRDSKRSDLHQPLFALLEDLTGPHPRLDAIKEQWQAALALPDGIDAAMMRDVADRLRPIAQALFLRAEQQRDGSDPMIPHVIDHLLVTSEPGYDALADAGLGDRVQALVG